MESLFDLDRSLRRLGATLIVRSGDPVAETVAVARQVGTSAVHLNEDVSRYAQARERRLRLALAEHGMRLQVHAGNAVVPPGDVVPVGKTAHSVFTPYHRSWAEAPRRPIDPVPARIELPPGLEPGPRPDPGAVRPTSPDLVPGGEAPGRKRLETYLAGDGERYGDVRNDLAADRTSRLSPHLRFGCISANEMAHVAAEVPGAEELIRQLAWRDFYGQLLASDPSLQWRDFREPPGDIPLAPPLADSFFESWQHGRTGIPLVDAGMRQLRREGWMHNRARMVVASYLTRRLGIAWQRGAAHFMRWLVDGDPGNNAGGWQWASGTGTDPRRSRAFNPVRQAERFDPEGVYVRRYVRELRGTPTAQIFAPWTDPALLEATGYPPPILEVPSAVSRRSSLAQTSLGLSPSSTSRSDPRSAALRTAKS